MLINGNLVGFGMVVVSALIIALPGCILKLPDLVTMIGVGVVLVAADLIIRLLNRGREKWLMGQRTGGYLFFIPVWIFGMGVIVANIINAVVGLK
jgi:hypothetical protein